MKKSVMLKLDRFGQDALDEYVRGSGGSRAAALHVALRYYLADSGSGRVAWGVPRHAGSAGGGDPVELELDDRLHRELEQESGRQRVAPDLLAVHALMYFLADLDSGRAAARLGDAVRRDAEAW
jgi:hypothetical protein